MSLTLCQFCGITISKIIGNDVKTHIWIVWEWPPQKPEIIYQKMCIYSYMFKLQSCSKYSPFDAMRLSRCFSQCSNQFVNGFDSDAFQCFRRFSVSPLPHRQNVPLWAHFSCGETKKSCLGQDWVNREGGTCGSSHFGSKTTEHLEQCEQVHS